MYLANNISNLKKIDFIIILILLYTMSPYNLPNLNSTIVDRRGHTWIQISITQNDREFLEQVRKDWIDVSDNEIIKSKQKITGFFGDNIHGIQGLPCKNFIYMFSNDNINHYFACTDENLDPVVIKCKGEREIHFNQNAEFDFIIMQRDIAM